jgi:hypothetical protein
VPIIKLSGEKAIRNHAPYEAYDFYKEAVELLKRFPETEENKKKIIEVLNSMQSPLLILGFPEGSLSYLQLGERLLKELGDTRGLAGLYTGMGLYYTFGGDHSMAIKYTEEGFERKSPGKPEEGRGHVPGNGDGILAGKNPDALSAGW